MQVWKLPLKKEYAAVTFLSPQPACIFNKQTKAIGLMYSSQQLNFPPVLEKNACGKLACTADRGRGMGVFFPPAARSGADPGRGSVPGFYDVEERYVVKVTAPLNPLVDFWRGSSINDRSLSLLCFQIPSRDLQNSFLLEKGPDNAWSLLFC